MLLWPPLTGTQLSPVAPRSWVLPSGHDPSNRHDRRAKPASRGSQIAKYAVVKLKKTTITPFPFPRQTLQATRAQRAGTEDGASRSGNGAIQGGIAALSETRFSEEGQLEEVDAGYTFLWSGLPKSE
ncbi:unnamed protein product [Schistocephalus solidus]|uniref:Uncharacterized protein n=1 Tax=Schistocephalus solidus TaxID=70667 RepID=A0A183TS95_SCHSO|nr:unnamed protein product [Schistocephalus solidus]